MRQKHCAFAFLHIRLGLLCFVLLIFASCADSVKTPSPTPTPQLTSQYEFTAQDSGKTVTYVVTSRFQILLNQQLYPKEQVHISCTPSAALGTVSNLPSVTPPLYVLRYETVFPGKCTIKNGDFLLTVITVAST